MQPSSSSSSSSQQPGPPPSAGQQKPLSSELIQSYLDQNQLYITAIVENQSMGKLAAAMEYQLKLQQNLLYLSSLADQSPPPSQPSPTSQAK